MTHKLEFDRLSKQLSGNKADEEGRLLFNDVSGSVQSGETVALLGVSGQGKSTLMRMLALLERPQSGTILLDGSPPSSMEPRLWRRMVCYTAQLPVMLPGTVEHNLAAPSRLQGQPYDVQLAQRLLQDLGLGAMDTGQSASELSGGEKQRISLIRSLLLRPAVLLLDEITASLDQGSTHSVESMLARWQRDEGTAIVWITHHLEQARRIGSRVWFMAEQTLLEDAETETFFNKPSTSQAAAFWAASQPGGDNASLLAESEEP